MSVFYAKEKLSGTIKAGENQPDEGERAWLPATLEECLEALGILLDKSGAEPSGAFSFWRLARAN